MSDYACVPGIRVEALGDLWAAFSPASGETLLLNDTSAALLELLAGRSMSEVEVVEALAAEAATPRPVVDAALRAAWQQLIEAGLLRQVEPVPGP